GHWGTWCHPPALTSLRATRSHRGPRCRRERGDGHQGPPRPPSAAPCPAELQMMVEHHLKQAQGGDDDEEVAATARCHRGDPEHRHSPGGSCPLAAPQSGHRTPGDGTPQAGTPRAGTPGTARRGRAEDGSHREPGASAASGQ
ncbi:protein phosphatase 1 regulatory subunit 1A-like, partial [Malurus melanocephalus]|uniref:protein phosphatase 1 regulatory subunit 1A-like n=1 Tax=Malurus melanocephalus TaxID=175006 RepID=UPI0025478D1D